MLLATKLKNRILLAAKPEDLPLKIELKNIIVNGVKRGCSGFVTNMQTGSCVYIDTEKLVYGPLSDKCMYRGTHGTIKTTPVTACKMAGIAGRLMKNFPSRS